MVVDDTSPPPPTLSSRELALARFVLAGCRGHGAEAVELYGTLLASCLPAPLLDAIARTPWWPLFDDNRLAVVAMYAAHLAAPRPGGDDWLDVLAAVGLAPTDAFTLCDAAAPADTNDPARRGGAS